MNNLKNSSLGFSDPGLGGFAYFFGAIALGAGGLGYYIMRKRGVAGGKAALSGAVLGVGTVVGLFAFGRYNTRYEDEQHMRNFQTILNERLTKAGIALQVPVTGKFGPETCNGLLQLEKKVPTLRQERWDLGRGFDVSVGAYLSSCTNSGAPKAA